MATVTVTHLTETVTAAKEDVKHSPHLMVFPNTWCGLYSVPGSAHVLEINKTL